MTPGTYLRLRREAAGLSIEDLAIRIDTTPKVPARSRGELIDLIESDTAAINAEFVDALSVMRTVGEIEFDRHVLIQLVAIHAGAAIAVPEICRSCGCSWNDPCGAGCSWATADHDWCSACAAEAVDSALAEPSPAPVAMPTSAAA